MTRPASILSNRAGLFASVVLGLLLALIVLASAGIGPASAQTYTPNPAMDPAEEAFRFRKWLERTKPSDFTTAQQASANRTVLTNTARSRVPTLAGSVLRGGLAGAAVGIWVHNGVSLYNASQCGNANCPPEIHLDAEFKRTVESDAARYVETNTSGGVIAYLYLTTADYNYSAGSATTVYRFVYSGNPRCGPSCFVTTGVSTSGSTVASGGAAYGTNSVPLNTDSRTTTVNMPSTAVQRRVTMVKSDGSTTTLIPVGPVESPGNYRTPIYDWGSTDVVSAPVAGSATVSPGQSQQMFYDVQDTVTAPEAPPDVTPETAPDYFPQEWEEEFPDVGEPGKQDDPYGDPDEDGQPNHADPDDDGDGLPDEEDDQPFVPLPDNDPRADPDEDGQPNESDPDDDGDEIPDDEDPEPYVPTDPATLPQDHPYADPDEDGQPNRNDQDDDGDGVPDTEDPAPYDPTEPGAEPDPGQDTDGDAVPNRIDPDPENPAKPGRWTRSDRDGDFSPDSYDPSPDDPAIPATEPTPTSDSDGDGTPNQHDPYPQDQTNPESSPDLDGDQQPNTSDPDPYRPDQPTGGTEGDADGDGVDNPEDEYPQDPNRPNDQTEGNFCPIPRKVKFDVELPELANVFPFSLVMKSLEVMAELVSPNDHLMIDAPGLGTIESTPAVDTLAATMRGIIGLVMGIGMGFWFYRYITGRGSE